jgi:hypothetical protein
MLPQPVTGLSFADRARCLPGDAAVTAINRQPTGWLGFLGIKNFGRNPSTAAQVLAPTWDLADLYLAQSRKWLTTSIAVNALGNYPCFGPPAGQVWHVWSFGGITPTLGTGETCDLVPLLWNAALGYGTPLSAGNNLLHAVGHRATVALPYPIILTPGDQVGFAATRFTIGTLNTVVNCCYTILDA